MVAPQSVPSNSTGTIKHLQQPNLGYTIFTCLLVIGLKLAWRDVPVTEPRIFLAPLVTALEGLLGSPFVRQSYGYVNLAWNVTITKDCAGMNYFLIVHCLLVFSHLRYFQNREKPLVYLVFLVGAFLMTWLANLSRIILSLFLGRSGLIPSVMTGTPHLALGTFVYFCFLVGANVCAAWITRYWTMR